MEQPPALPSSPPPPLPPKMQPDISDVRSMISDAFNFLPDGDITPNSSQVIDMDESPFQTPPAPQRRTSPPPPPSHPPPPAPDVIPVRKTPDRQFPKSEFISLDQFKSVAVL